MAEDIDFESFENLDDLDWSELEKDLQEAPAESGDAAAAPPDGASAPSGEAAAQPVSTSEQIEIGYLLDVVLQATVEVGKTHTFISSVLAWDHGSIIELEKLVGEPLNLLINGKPVAKGEVVVLNEKFALKITEVLDPKDRLNYLQG
ncbi:MAG: flagellar motor switch protein FliN [SAR324 cluster bacterium]|nr:flagellar motor switch protein FliN [SAR324 cluster bacterium]